MTTQIDSTSPFSGSTTNNKNIQENPVATDDFLIHTMQDDLLALENKIDPDKNIIDAQPVHKMETAPLPESFKKPIRPEDISSEVVHPYFEQVAAPKQNKPDAVEVPVNTISIPENNDIPADNTKKTFYKILVVSIIVLLIAIAGLGIYYFLVVRTPVVTEQPAPIKQVSDQEMPAITVPTEKYFAVKPNYLPIDLNVLSADEIKKSIGDVVEELKEKTIQSPYEFIVVDNNNNPVAFPIFATAAKFNLSSAILSDLGETFSIFIYNDNGNMRLAVVAEIIKGGALPVALSKQEKTFTTDAAFLFLNEKPEITKGVFQNNLEYKDASVRFLNVNSQKTLSIDYAIFDKQLVIATSKNTMRAVLDKLTLEKAGAEKTQAVNQESSINSASNSDISTSVKNDSSTTVSEKQSAVESAQNQTSVNANTETSSDSEL